MRITIDLADDVMTAVEAARCECGLGLSEAINDLVRACLALEGPKRPIDPPSYDMGLNVDISNVGEVLELCAE